MRQRSIAAAGIALTTVLLFQECGCKRVEASQSICDDRGFVPWVNEYVTSFLYNASFVEGSVQGSRLATSDGVSLFSLGRTDVPQGNSFKSCNVRRGLCPIGQSSLYLFFFFQILE